MVSFYLSSLEVENFRGIKNLEIQFPPDRSMVFIGPNNCGKSTILDAIGLCISSPKFYNYHLCEQDFWTDGKGSTSDFFTITIKFKTRENGQLPAVKGGVGDPVDVHGVRIVGNIETLETERTLIDDLDNTIFINKGSPISAKKKEAYKGMELTGRRYARPRDISSFLPEIWQLDPENLFVSLYEWRTGPLQKLLGIYKQKLFSDEWVTTNGKQMPAALHQAQAFLSQSALRTPFWETVLSPKFTEKFQEYLGAKSSPSILPSMKEIEDWLLSEFLIKVSPRHGLTPVDCQKLGDGWQSLMRLVALEVLCDLQDPPVTAVILAEEPETYLHPHLRRKMRKVFQRLQGLGYQIIFTSHSPEMISFNEKQIIARLSMTENGVALSQYSTTASSVAVKQEEKLHERGNHEMLFAQKVILVEGKSDKYAAILGLEKLGFDIDSNDISVMDCGSVGNLPDYAEICTSLNIPWYAIHDRDILPDGSEKHNVKAAREKLEQLKGATDCIDFWDNDLESAITCPQPKANPEWINNAYGSLSWNMLNDGRMPNYCNVIARLNAWL